ncbi:MAG: methionine--tRNA ligase [Parachlamydiaceae bacterium]|nr:methionine--tRNA ligase [Parachlamydiaceae bacterium]
MEKKILITSALPYANGPLHFGHIAGAYLPGDCYARFQRMQKGKNVLYICGSDEYGVAITLSAELAGRTPQQHVDMYHEVIQDLFNKLNFSFDHYSRTTWPGHVETTQQFFTELLENGFIEDKITDQLYSVADNRFLADRYVVGTCPKCGFQNARGDECTECGASYEATDLNEPRSKITNAPLILQPTQHWFLKLEMFKERLTEWLDTRNWKPNVANFIKGYVAELHSRSITRDSTWGVPIPLPDTEGKILYVWFDAPIGYISSTKEWAEKIGDKERWKEFWCDRETKVVSFIGKDNIPFHAAIFPAMIMGQNSFYKLVDELPANEFYKLEGRQFSKSDGWFIDLDDFFNHYTADQIRYTIAANAPETADSEFTWKDFQIRCNTELLGKYGNLVNRVLTFAHRQCEGKVPLPQLEEIDEVFLKDMQGLIKEAFESYDQFKLRRVCQVVMELAQLGNVYFDSKHPWKDAKGDENARKRMETTIYCCLECLKSLALISFPLIPETSTKVWKMIGNTNDMSEEDWAVVTSKVLPVNQKLGEPEILFQRVEDAQIDKEIEKLHAMSEKCENAKPIEYAPLKPIIEIDTFQQIDLRVGKILEAAAVPKSKKLLQLKVDLGFEQRSILSGISQYYKPEELVGKRVAVIANLKPAKLMGIESQGMLLAGSLDKALELLSVQDLPAGSCIT